jgi:endonuclease-3
MSTKAPSRNHAEDRRVRAIISLLRQRYDSPRTVLRFSSPFHLLVATILSAQCTDKKVNEVTETLFARFAGPEDFARLRQEDLERDIRSTGFYRNKAKNIIAASKMICDEFNGSVPDTMSRLITLPGVARKTANIVLSSAFNRAEGIAVDTHVKRISQRLGLSRHDNPDKIERDLMNIVPRECWIDINYMLVEHGRAVCTARKPQCGSCMINHLCPGSQSEAPASF